MDVTQRNRFLKALDAQGLKELGAQHVGYIRPISFLGGTHFAVHAADGSPMTITSSRELALSLLASTDMEEVPVH